MDDWDPFAVDDSEPSPAVKAVTSATAGKESGPATRISEEEEDIIVKQLVELMLKEEDWKNPNVMKADMSWYTPTCDSYNWKHIDVKFEVSEGIAYVILNRAKENNTINDTLGLGLNDALFALHSRPDLRVAVFTGEGAMFCAGGDPKNWQANALRLKGIKVEGDGTVGHRITTKEPTEEVLSNICKLQIKAVMSGAYSCHFSEVGHGQLSAAKQWHTWTNVPQFSICLANGSAMGGGVGMACMCDYGIAVKKAFFVVSEVRIGVIPATISPYVCAKIGASNAKRMFNTAKQMKAAEDAKDSGIINEVVENMKEGHKRVKAIAEELQSCSPYAVAAVKELVFNVAGQPILDSIMFYTALKAAECLAHEESKQGRECEVKGEKKPWELRPINPLY